MEVTWRNVMSTWLLSCGLLTNHVVQADVLDQKIFIPVIVALGLIIAILICVITGACLYKYGYCRKSPSQRQLTIEDILPPHLQNARNNHYEMEDINGETGAAIPDYECVPIANNMSSKNKQIPINPTDVYASVKKVRNDIEEIDNDLYETAGNVSKVGTDPEKNGEAYEVELVENDIYGSK